jgi:hypothetical protein
VAPSSDWHREDDRLPQPAFHRFAGRTVTETALIGGTSNRTTIASVDIGNWAAKKLDLERFKAGIAPRFPFLQLPHPS